MLYRATGRGRAISNGGFALFSGVTEHGVEARHSVFAVTGDNIASVGQMDGRSP